MELKQVYEVKATATPGAYMIHCNVIDSEGEQYDCDYSSLPDDVFGLNPVIRQWLIDNEGTYEVIPYVPPAEKSPAEKRLDMPSLSPRQLRLGLVRNGIALASVEAAIEAMPVGSAQDEARIEWEYAPAFRRMHPLISAVGSAVGLSDEQIDIMWQTAVDI